MAEWCLRFTEVHFSVYLLAIMNSKRASERRKPIGMGAGPRGFTTSSLSTGQYRDMLLVGIWVLWPLAAAVSLRGSRSTASRGAL